MKPKGQKRSWAHINQKRRVKKLLKRAEHELKKAVPDFDKVIRLQTKASLFLQDDIAIAIARTHNRNARLHQNQPGPTTRLHFQLDKISERQVKKYGAHTCAYKAKITGIPKSNNLLKDSMNALENVFNDIISTVKEKCKLKNPKQDRLRLMLTSDSLKKPLSTRLVPVQEQTPSLMLAEISKVLQSEENISFDDTLTVDVVALKAPIGRGRQNYKVLNYGKHSKLKKSIVRIRNSDDLCMARAIVTGRAMVDNA